MLQYETSFYVVLNGDIFLKKNWNKEIKAAIEMHIQSGLKTILNIHYKKIYETFDLTNLLIFTDLTYYTQDENVKPRRVQTIGGILRRIFSFIETDIKNENLAATHNVFNHLDSNQQAEKEQNRFYQLEKTKQIKKNYVRTTQKFKFKQF